MRGGWCGVEETKDSGRMRRGLDESEGESEGECGGEDGGCIVVGSVKKGGE